MIRINHSRVKTTLKAAILASVLALFAAAPGFSQSVNLTAGPTTATMPDGTVVPMWGYTCGAAVTGSTATCAPLTGSVASVGPAAVGALGGIYVLNGGSGYSSATTITISAPTGTIPSVTNSMATATPVINGGVLVGINVTNHGMGYIAAPTVTIADTAGSGAVAAAAPAWSPVVITVPSGTLAAPASLTINLTNTLSFGSTPNNIPTSIVMIGQVGGGLGVAPVLASGTGGTPTNTMSPDHSAAQGCVTWFIASTQPGTPCLAPQGVSGAPPIQPNRVQSMAAEVEVGTTASTLTWSLLKPGTYLMESGTHPSVQVPMGLIGMLVVTTAPAGTTAGIAYPATAASSTTGATNAVTYNAEVPLEFSEIDPVQNKAVDQAVRTVGFSETAVWSAMNNADGAGAGGCGQATIHTCYPPTVNYTPFYFLINGLAFDKANPSVSLFAATAGTSIASPITGNLLVRMVNAGVRMHVPSIVGSQTTGFNGAGAPATVGGFTLVAEDGNVIPGLASATSGNVAAPRVQTDVFMAASKVFDVMVNVPATPTGATAPPSLPVFDRELSLSANSSVRDAGMLAYISVNGAALPAATGTTGGIFATAVANPDTYDSISCPSTATACTPLVVSDPSKGVIANDVNVYGVTLSSAPTGGTLVCNALPSNPVAGICANGTFTYTPAPGTTTDSFGYCANGAATGTTGLCTTVALGASALAGNPVANPITYTSKMATFLKIAPPGVLSVDSDPSGLPLQVLISSVVPSGVTVNMDATGAFTASATTAGTYTFTYQAQNSQGRLSTAAMVTLVFPPPSNLKVNVLDAQAYNNCNGNSACISTLVPFPDYRWIIEEDKTFWVDPNCTTNSSITTPGCPGVVASGGSIPVFGVQFHTSSMDFVAQGCTGPVSCEFGQTMLDTRQTIPNPSGPGTIPNPNYNQHIPAVCDLGAGACRPDPGDGATSGGLAWVNPSQVVLDPAKRYYISVLPGDAGNPFPAYVGAPECETNGAESPTTNLNCGHTMSGSSIPPACNILGGPNACSTTSVFTQPVTVLTLPTPLPTGKLSVIVFEDDFPLNGEQDGGGGNGTVAPIEGGLGGFNLVLWDTYGGFGDFTGQDTYDEFNQPLSNSLSGTVDPVTGLDACPVSANATTGPAGAGPAPAGGITGTIVTCPKYEADGTTLSPLAGQAVIANLMPDKFSVQAYPGADRIARGEQWVQTNTLDGQHPHDSFIRIGEPSYFQEYGPAGYHVAIGFANPAIINSRHDGVCNGFGTPGAVGPCSNTIDGQINVQRLSRTPDQRLYPSGSHDALTWTQCWVSLGDPDGEDFMFTFCDANGNFRFTNVPGGDWRLTIGDQWNDQIIDGLSTPANLGCIPTPPATTCTGGLSTLHMGEIGVQQWQSNLYTRTFIDDNKDGIWEPNEIGIPFIYTMIHYRDGHTANNLTSDFNGVANFNEEFPLFNWYVVEADSGRYKTTGMHTVYDAGGPADGTPSCGPTARPCGTSTAYNFLANTYESVPLPSDLSVPGAVYCATADCAGEAAGFAAGTAKPSSAQASTGRIDPPWVWAEGWSGLTSQGNWIDIGKAPYAACPPACATVSTTAAGSTTPTTAQVGENGGIHGLVVYASTRPFDDASQMIQQPWEPNVPNVTMNLYQEGFAADGVTPTLTLVDTTKTSSWDDWAQGFYPNYTDPTSGTSLPYMSCPGQGKAPTTSGVQPPNADLFFFTLFDQPNYLDYYNGLHSTPQTAPHALPYNSQYKCYDAMHIWNQLQPAPYDGRYFFPSSIGIDPTSGKPLPMKGITNGVASSMNGTNCTVCVANPDSTDAYRYGTAMLPPGKYVVQVVMPPGYEIYKEEDKNLLIGDDYIAPVTQEFAGVGGDVFIVPDQASVASMYDETPQGYNPNNFQNSTTSLGLANKLSGVPGFPGFQDPNWPCVGEMRVVPDYLSLFPAVQEVGPFAGATRPLCDRKEVTLPDQQSVSAKFFVFTSTHIASKYTGVITDDFTSEFDPFAPQFGEKFSPPNLPVSTKDYLGNEISRVYSDHWGIYDGLTYSSWEVNPPNITGYSPSMMVQCMNDPGPILDNNISSPTYGQMIVDPLYNPAYSNFCYEQPYMPGLTLYADTPVVPTEAFVGAAYNSPDCSYPDATPAIKEVDGDGVGPWVAGVQGAVISVAVTSGGSGYTTAPGVSFSSGGGTGATGTAVLSGSVTSVAVSREGRGYTSAPAITFSGGGGSGAAATANMTGSVSAVNITNGGSGYTNTPGVTFSAPGCTGCATAAGTAIRNRFTGRITGVTITSPGSGYTTAPTVTFAGGGGTGAAGTAVLEKSVASVTVTNAGSGYSSAPTVSFASPGFGGQSAQGTATINATVVAVNVTNGGTGYAPSFSVTFTGTGGAAATATSETGGSLTISSLGNQSVTNSAYSGPSANTAPFNLKTITRHYGFGMTQCTSPTAGSATCNTLSSVTIGGKTAPITSWSDTQITVTVPGGVPNCAIQQQKQYKGSNAQCGQLVITAGNGLQSIDAVTVTIGGKAPTHVSVSGTIQGAIDAAAPGDLLIVDPTCMTVATTGAPSASATCDASALHAGTPTQTASVGAHSEMLLMWKPVRLQGVGAASSIIDANANPAGKLLDPWRRHVNCLFGLTLNGVPNGSTSATGTVAVYDPNSTYSCPDAGWNYFGSDLTGTGGGSDVPNAPQVDRLPLEAVVGWDATVNGNLAEQLQEPSLMGAYEGAGITVLAKGVWIPSGENPWTDGSEPGAFPIDALLLQNVPAFVDDAGARLGPQFSYCDKPGTSSELIPNPYPSNFECNPSSIDGLTVRDSSQGGGGVFVHGWAHNLQIANNRVYNNAGSLSGGITVGQGEFPVAIKVVATGTFPSAGEFVLDSPPSCQNSTVIGTELPYCLDMNVNVHNNYITSNSSLGDELFSGTLAGGGGVSFCTGSDYYKFQYNWVCGNLSTAEGGGLAHMGFIYNGDIEHNAIVLNQSTNPTIPTNGGGIMVMGTPDTDPVCGNQIDQDCPPGLSDGTGPNLTINANLIQNNTAESGSGGGIRLQQVNGTDVATFNRTPSLWNSVSITNNIIVDNIVGWDGGGISLQDSLNVIIRNNTISSNDSLASSGVLTQSIGTPDASAPAGNCVKNGPTGPTTASCPQSAGVTSTQNTSLLTTTFTGLTITCPFGSTTYPCKAISNPMLDNNIISQNRSFYIGISGPGTGNQNQQNLISLFDAFGSTPAPVQTAWGQCTSGVSYWDIGVRGDTGPGNHTGGRLNPTYSVLDDPADYSTGNNQSSFTGFVSQYCNGSRVPPNCTVLEGCGGPSGYGVPPGIVDASTPNPVFSLTPAATVDEGNNWVNVSSGPLALSNDSVTGGANGNYGGGAPFANYSLTAAMDNIPATGANAQPHPSTDFFGNPRPDPFTTTGFDPGAVEVQAVSSTNPTVTGISPNSGYRGQHVAVTITGTNLTGAAVTVSGTGVTVSGITVTGGTTINATFNISNGATLGGRNVTITTGGGSVTDNGAFTVLGPSLTSISPTSGLQGATVPVTLSGEGLQDATTVAMNGTGIACTRTGTPTVTTVTASCVISGTAATTSRNVTVNTPDGNVTLLDGFNVGTATLTGISPASGERGTTVVVNLTGTGLASATGVTLSTGGAGTICPLSGTATTTTVSASCAIPANASLSADDVTVNTPGGNATLPAAFQVTGARLLFSAPSPALTTFPGNTTTKSGTITVTNLAGATAASVTFNANPTAGGTGFSILSGGTCINGFALSPGSTCTIVLQYAPGTSTANAPGTVTLTGLGLAAGTQTSQTFFGN